MINLWRVQKQRTLDKKAESSPVYLLPAWTRTTEIISENS